MTKTSYLFATLFSFVLAGQAVAAEDVIRVDKSIYRHGEIVWIDNPMNINTSFTVSREDALRTQNLGSLGGEPGVLVSGRPGMVDSSSLEALTWPRSEGLPDSWVLTLFGDMEFVYPGQRLSWHRDQWLLPAVNGGRLTDKFVYSRGEGGTIYSEALFHGPFVHRWTDLFTNEVNSIRLSLTGKLQMALYCAKDTCRLPDTAGPFIAQVAINTPLVPAVSMPLAQSSVAKTLRFKRHSSCTLNVAPVRHYVGVLSLSGRQPVPRLLTKDFKSTFSVVCGEDERRRAHVAFGTYWPVSPWDTPSGMRHYAIAKTNLNGIGIIYSTEVITKCSDAMQFGETLHVGEGRRGEFVGSASRDFHFALCNYKSTVEKGPLKGSLYYNFWLD